MTLNVDPAADAAYLRFLDTDVVDSQEVSPGLVLDYDADGTVVGVESLDLSTRGPETTRAGMTRRLMCAAVGVWLALGVSVALAQAPADSVEIGGWTLPEGAIVHSMNQMTYKATAYAGGQQAPYRLTVQDSTVTRIDQVTAGRLQRAVQRVAAMFSTTTVAEQPQPSYSDPLTGCDVVITRTADGWTQAPQGWTPSADEDDALADPTTLDDDEYPLRMGVGQTVEVSQDAIARVYLGAADGPHRLTGRLDSVGTRDGAPVAYLTQTVDVTTASEVATTRMQMRARIVRHLGWLIDIDTRWTGSMTTDYGTFSIDGFADHRATQTVDLPDGAR